MSSKSFVLRLIFLYVWLPSYKAQQSYQLLVTRDIGSISNPGPGSNLLTLRCRDQFALDLTDPRFWLNDTQQELTERLGQNFVQGTTTLTFQITRELEGNYFCGPDSSSVSSANLIVAYPLSEPSLLPRTQRIILNGTDTVILPPLVSPGALVQQYFIDWQNAQTLQTVARIQGPRNLPQMEQDPRFSINPDTFALTISPVRFEDQGSYLGVVGVVDPAGASLMYTQTELINITLEINVPPTIISSPVDKVVSSSSTTFTCQVEGYPQPVISWFHSDVKVTNSFSSKYRITESAQRSGNIPFTVESTLTVMNLTSLDSGNVTCVAMVALDTGSIFTQRRTSQLSVLGKLDSYSTLVTLDGWVIVRAFLTRQLPTEVQLLIQYTDTVSGARTTLTTPTSYAQTQEITFVDESVPYQRFTVSVALVSGSVMGPLSQGNVVYDLSAPSSSAGASAVTTLQYAITLGVVGAVALVAVVVAVVFICCCSHPRLCVRNTITRDSLDLRLILSELQALKKLREGQIGSSKYDETDADGPPKPQISDSSQSNGSQGCLQFCCYETKEEKKARETLEEIRKILQQRSKQSVPAEQSV